MIAKASPAYMWADAQHRENELFETSRKVTFSTQITVLRKSLVALSIGVTYSWLLKDTVNSMLFT